MTRTKEEQAAYMREYRAKKKLEQHNASQGAPIIGGMATSMGVRVEEMPAILKAAKAAQESVNALGAGDPREAKIAELEAEIARLTELLRKPVPLEALPTEIITARIGDWTATLVEPKPSFLAAPDDDCATCKHDRHIGSHTNGPCQYPTGPRRKCLCDDYDLGFE